MKSTCAYLRVSSDKQDVTRQRESIERWAKRTSTTIDLWFEDSEGRNPRDMAHKRAGFQRLLKAVEAGLVSTIVVDSQDRFGTRDAYQWGSFLTLLRDHGCKLSSADGKELSADDDASVLTSTLGALTSSREQKEKAHRNITGKIRLAKLGEYQGGNPAFGFDVVCFNGADEKWRTVYFGHYQRVKVYPDGKREAFNGKDNSPRKDATDALRVRPTIEKERLNVVKSIFKWFATEAISTRQIATRLNQAKVDPVFGCHWDKVKIGQMLRNPIYIGLPTWNKQASSRFVEFIDGEVRDVAKVNGKVKQGRDRQAVDFVQPEKPQFKAIIDAKTWAKVQAKLEAAKQGARTPARTADLWLKPFLICGGCNKPMRSAIGGGSTRMPPNYYCGTYALYGKSNPTGCHCHRVKHSVIAEIVDRYIAENAPKVADLLEATETGNLELAKPLLAQLNIAENQRGGVWLDMLAFVEEKGTARELAKLRKAGASFDELYGLIYERMRPKLEAEIAKRETQLDTMLEEFRTLSPKLRTRANKAMEAIQAEIDQFKRDASDLRQPWHNLRENVAQRQAALDNAQAVLSNGAAGRQKTEALNGVVDRIVCHFSKTETKAGTNHGRSVLQSVEILAVSGEKQCFPNGIVLGRG